MSVWTNKVVLLLEDEPDLAGLVTELLTDAGFSIIHVTTPDAMLSEAARYSPCVALVDGLSPTNFDLWWLGPRLSALGVPAVAFTAHGGAVEEFERDAHEFAGIITKPFDAEEFIAVVNEICWDDHHRQAS